MHFKLSSGKWRPSRFGLNVQVRLSTKFFLVKPWQKHRNAIYIDHVVLKLWNCRIYLDISWPLLCISTRVQLWPSGIVVACVCMCVCVSVCMCVNHLLVQAAEGISAFTSLLLYNVPTKPDFICIIVKTISTRHLLFGRNLQNGHLSYKYIVCIKRWTERHYNLTSDIDGKSKEETGVHNQLSSLHYVIKWVPILCGMSRSIQ